MSLRSALSRAGDLRRKREASLSELRETLSPVFVIGANRSGTSVITAILAQHPDLEGLFGGTEEKTDASGHSIGFCESMHVWSQLRADEAARRRNRHVPFWALPQYLTPVYRDRARSDRERFDLAWSIRRLQRTQKQPLLKDQFNTLRVGLVVDVLPKARFLLVTRGWASFARRGIDKWRNDSSGTMLEASRPRVAFHWFLANSIARFDLETYAPGQYSEIWLDTVQSGPEPARAAFDRITLELGLTPWKFDLSQLATQWARRTEPTSIAESPDFSEISRLVNAERELYREQDGNE